MGDAANVLVGADGGVQFGPTGTTLPADADDVLDAAFDDLGFISDDGLTEAIGSSTNKIKNWAGSTVREVQTEHDVTYKFTLLETNPTTEEVFYGNDPAEGIAAVQGTRGCWVFDVFDGDTILRVVVPDGQITDRGDVVYKNDEAVAYEVTVTAYEDEAGKKAYKYRSTGS